jgi:hypothetical protein
MRKSRGGFEKFAWDLSEFPGQPSCLSWVPAPPCRAGSPIEDGSRAKGYKPSARRSFQPEPRTPIRFPPTSAEARIDSAGDFDAIQAAIKAGQPGTVDVPPATKTALVPSGKRGGWRRDGRSMQAGRLRSQGPAFRLRRVRQAIPHRAAALGARASRLHLLVAPGDASESQAVLQAGAAFLGALASRRQPDTLESTGAARATARSESRGSETPSSTRIVSFREREEKRRCRRDAGAPRNAAIANRTRRRRVRPRGRRDAAGVPPATRTHGAPSGRRRGWPQDGRWMQAGRLRSQGPAFRL